MSCNLGMYYYYLSYLLSGSILYKTKTPNETLPIQNGIFSGSTFLKKDQVDWITKYLAFFPTWLTWKVIRKRQLQSAMEQLHTRHNWLKWVVENIEKGELINLSVSVLFYTCIITIPFTEFWNWRGHDHLTQWDGEFHYRIPASNP